MQFTLNGFTQDNGCRVFAYQGIGEDRVRVKFTVRVDLAMSRQYGMRLQELPLMCLALLERNSATAEPEVAPIQHHVTFTEEAMIRFAEDCAAVKEAALARKHSSRRQPAKEEDADAPAVNSFNDGPAVAVKPFGNAW